MSANQVCDQRALRQSKEARLMTTPMHGHLTEFLTGYIAHLGRKAEPPVSRHLEDMASRLPEFDAETLESLWCDIALWLDRRPQGNRRD